MDRPVIALEYPSVLDRLVEAVDGVIGHAQGLGFILVSRKGIPIGANRQFVALGLAQTDERQNEQP